MQFLIEVGAAVVGGLVLLVMAGVLSREARWILTAAVSRWLAIDIDFVFDDRTAVQLDLKREIASASEIAILAGRGNELQREAFSSVFLQGTMPEPRDIRILLPNPRVADGATDWVRQREDEIAAFDPAFGTGLLRAQIETNISFVLQHVKRGSAKLRLYNSPHIGRIVITERCAFVTAYRSGTHGRSNRVYKLRRGDMHDALRRLFAQLWEAGAEPHDSE
jgi:hypothetical protein